MAKKEPNTPSNAISVYKTGKGLVELRDKFNPAFWDNYAELGGHPDTGNGKLYSNIGVVVYDYTNGTGQNTVKVYVNITPEDVFWTYNSICLLPPTFELEQTKIFGSADQTGYSQMTKLKITRNICDRNGEVRRYPWTIAAENGVGIAQHTRVGGTYCQSGSYKTLRKAVVSLSDYDIFKLFNRAVRYITQFENAYCPAVIHQGRIAWKDYQQQCQVQQTEGTVNYG